MTTSSNISKNLLSNIFFVVVVVKHRSVMIPWIKGHFDWHHFPSRSKQMLSIVNGAEPES